MDYFKLNQTYFLILYEFILFIGIWIHSERNDDRIDGAGKKISSSIGTNDIGANESI